MKEMGRRWGKERSRRGWEDSLEGGEVGSERGYSLFELLMLSIVLILIKDVLMLPKLLLFVFYKYISGVPRNNALKLHHSHFHGFAHVSLDAMCRQYRVKGRVDNLLPAVNARFRVFNVANHIDCCRSSEKWQ